MKEIGSIFLRSFFLHFASIDVTQIYDFKIKDEKYLPFDPPETSSM